MSSKTLRVAVIGLGAMGVALASAILRSGAKVRVWNRTRSKSEAIQAEGAIVCDTAADAIEESEYIVVCVSNYSTWQSIVGENNGGFLSGRKVIQLTTGTMDEVKAHRDWVHNSGGELIDGSIISFPTQIGTDEAFVIVAGEQATMDSCHDILDAVSPSYAYLGDDVTMAVVLARAYISQALGMILGTINGAALCQAGGVSLSHLTRNNPIMNTEITRLCVAIESGNTEETVAAIKTWAEGQVASLEIAKTLNVDTQYQTAVIELLQRANEGGLGDHDISALINLVGVQK